MCARRLAGCLLTASAVLIMLLCGGLALLYLVAGPSLACRHPAGDALQAGVSARMILSGGRERCYLFYLPPALDRSQPVPVVMSLHGFASNARSQERVPGWDRIADAEGFMVVYPEGTSFPLRWNAADLFLARTVDDVQFFRDIVTDLAGLVPTDLSRIYVTGISNGGAMANRIACEASDVVAAIGTVAAVPVEAPGGCTPDRPVPVIAFHGTADPVVRYGGRVQRIPESSVLTGPDPGSLAYPAVETWIMAWAERNGCDPAAEVLPGSGDARAIRYSRCEGDAEVVLYTIEGGGHTWPGGLSVPFMGRTSQDIDASAVMWAFFQLHSLPSSPIGP